MSPHRVGLALIAAGMLAGIVMFAQSGGRPGPGPAALAQSQPARAESLTLRIIVVSTREEAEALRSRLVQGEDFAAAARRESIDPSAGDAGLLGRIDVATLRTEVRSALAGLSAGQLSPVVPVATGFAVLQVIPDAGSTPSAINPASLAAISAVGSVKYVPDVGGLPEAEALLRDFPKAADWNASPATICQARQDSLTVGTHRIGAFVVMRDGSKTQLNATFNVAHTKPHRLLVSASPERTAPKPLADATLTGLRYVFLGERNDKIAGARDVVFRIDGKVTNIDSKVPYDAFGNKKGGKALPLDTRRMRRGRHTATATVVLSGGALPLALLETRVRQWIAAEKGG